MNKNVSTYIKLWLILFDFIAIYSIETKSLRKNRKRFEYQQSLFGSIRRDRRITVRKQVQQKRK